MKLRLLLLFALLSVLVFSGCSTKTVKSEFSPSIDLTGAVISETEIELISSMKAVNENLVFQANKMNLNKLTSSNVYYMIRNSKDTIQHFTVTFKCRDFDLNSKFLFKTQKVEVQPKDSGVFMMQSNPLEGGMIICDVKAESEDLERSKRVEFMLS